MNWLYNVNSNKGYLSLWYQVHISHFWLYLFLISLNAFTHLIPTSFFYLFIFYLKDWWAFAISALWLLHSEQHVVLFFSLTVQAFNTADTEWKGLENKKGERHKRKCNLNSKHSSVMRQWVTAMGAQTWKDTFKSLHATLGTWASTCCRNIRLKAAAWEARGIQSDFLPTLISLIT